MVCHGHAHEIEIEVTAADRARSAAIVADRTSPQKACLAGADHSGDRGWLRHLGGDAPGRRVEPCAWRWQKRFMTEGVDGLLHDKARPARIPPLPGAVVEWSSHGRWARRRPTGDAPDGAGHGPEG